MKRSSFLSVPGGWFSLFTLAAFLLGSLFVPDARGAVTFAQQNARNFSSGNSGTVAFSGNTTAGDLVIVGLLFGPSVSVSSVGDSRGSAYQQIGSTIGSPSGQQDAALFYASNIPGGPDSVTVTLSGVPAYPGLGIYIFEYKGISKLSPLDGSAQVSGSSSTVASGAITATGSGDLLFGFCVSDAACSNGSGFTARSTLNSNLGEEKVLTASGSYSATATATAGWTMQAATFTATATDTTPPSVPSGLTASAASLSQINLAWNASTDNVGVAGYRVFRNGSQIAQIGVASYSDTGLASGTTYSYTVAAYDAAGNVSAQSPLVSVTTSADTAAPSVPTGLNASVVSSSQINLAWNASTDNVGVAGYRVFRNGSQIAQVSGTSYSDTGLVSATTYPYTVAAYDAAGNVSAQSSAVSATTQSPDTIPPSVPAGLTATAVSSSQINLSWNVSTDNVAVTGYKVFRNGIQVGVPTATSFSDVGLNFSTTYVYTVSALDGAGNASAQSSAVSATTLSSSTGATPTLVQVVNTSNTGGYLVTTYTVRLPNATLGGNCVVLAVQRGSGSGALTVSDDKGNAYNLGKANDDGNQAVSVFYALNAVPGAHTITLRFAGSGANYVAADAAEFYNVATAVALDGVSGNGGTSALVTAGNLTTTADNDLIFQYAAQDGDGVNTTWTQGGSPWVLLAADYFDAQAAQYQVQTAFGTIGPILTQNSSKMFNSVAIALKAATAGTAPTGIRVVHLGHNRVPQSSGSSLPLQFPSTGNLIVVSWIGIPGCTITGLFDGNSNAYNSTGPAFGNGGSGDGQLYYAPSAVTSTDLKGPTLNVTASGCSGGSSNALLYDISGAAASPFDGVAGRVMASGSQSTSGSVTTVTISPSTANGLVITQTGVTSHTLVSVSPGTFLSTENSPDIATGAVDNNNGWAINYNTGTGPETFVYGTKSGQLDAWASIAVAFEANIAGPAAPSNLTATDSTDTQINLAWTASTDSVPGYRLERCQGTACASFAQIASPAVTTYNDTGRTAGTSNSYRVRATDAAGNLSAYSNTASATTSDSVAPSAPSNLTATVAAGTQINLSWTASTDNVGVTGYRIERCQGTACSSFAQIGTSTAAAYSDTGLSSGASYSYRVLATDAAGNLSPYSNTASQTTVIPPTAPTNLSATASGGTQINLSWTASTSGIGILNYLVEQCQGLGCTSFLQIATPSATSYASTGLISGTQYSYRVRASDTSNNMGPYSNSATAATPDTIPPSAPSNLTATPAGTQINLTWTASADNVGVTAYLVERCQSAGCTSFGQIASQMATTYNDTGLTANTSYSYRVRATDASGNLSGYSATANAATNATIQSYGLEWPGDGAVRRMLYWHNPFPIYDATYIFKVYPHKKTATYSYYTTFFWGNDGDFVWDGGGANTYYGAHPYPTPPPSGPGQWEISVASSDVVTGTEVQWDQWHTQAFRAWRESSSITHHEFYWDWPDTSKVISVTVNDSNWASNNPPTPAIVMGQAPNLNGVSWGGYPGWEEFNGVIRGIQIYSGLLSLSDIQAELNAPKSSAAGQNFIWYLNTDPRPSDVTDKKGTGTLHNPSWDGTTALEWTDQTTSDTTPPSTPASESATAMSSSQINVSWTASTDNVGVTGYMIERCPGAGCANFGQVATTAGTSYNDAALAAGTSYSYRVRATDAAANLSGYSNTATATTNTAPPDTTPPTVPTSLVATTISISQINLSWTLSTDNVGVTGYMLERCQGAGCTTFSQVATPAAAAYSDTGLTAGASYSYRVRATDAAGNLSGYSNVATTPTLTTPPANGPAAAYAFNEGTGTTTADASGNGLTGTLINGPVWIAGKNGNALSFDGVNDKVSLASTLDIAVLPLTLEAWVLPANRSNWHVIFSKRSSYSASGMRFDVGLQTSSGRVYMTTFRSTVTFTYAPPLNTWTHLAVVADSTGTRLYVDGVLQQTLGVITLGTGSGAAVNIGRTGDNSDAFAGGIDDLRFYKRVLSPAEIQTDMNTPVQ